VSNEETTEPNREKRTHFILLLVGLVALAVSSIRLFDWLTWVLEVIPAVFGAALLIIIYRRFRFTTFAYACVLIHSLILFLGAHYSYAKVPLGFWVQDFLDLSRNHYDRVGHLAQGFFPAIYVREIFIRLNVVKRGWLFLVVTAVCLAVSAFYEFTEWWAAILGGDSAEAFLGTQGDQWDTQWDMFLCLLGAVLAQLFLGKLHDRAIERVR
jgi:putative membrane protein